MTLLFSKMGAVLRGQLSASDEPQKGRRGLAKHQTNPFVTRIQYAKTGTRRITNPAGDKAMIVSEHGEILAPAGFHEVVEVDQTQFVKLYINGVKAFKELTSAGTRVFEYVYRQVINNPGQDRIFIHYNEIDQQTLKISQATFFRGMKELVEKEFLAESMSPGFYFLNVDYMFNGNRLAMIKEYRLIKPTKKPDPRQMPLNLEPPDQLDIEEFTR